VTVNITNTGRVAGAEVAQLYLSYPRSEVDQPPKHLRGFAKAYLEPGESRMMTMQLVSTCL
jgi:beta-glucosidase